MSINEDEISTCDTDDALLSSSRQSSETIGTNQEVIQCCQPKKRNKSKCKSPRWYLVGSVVFLVWGLVTVIWTPFDLFMEERLRMRPGFPAFDWWKNPPDEVLVKAYIFNVTNSEEFLNKTDTKLNMVEVGPVVFMEKLTHTNVTFNDNGTMTYVATRKAIFLPEQTNIDLNATIIVPNWALLGIASYLSDQSVFIKLGYNLLTRTVQPKQFLTMTVYQFLWNYTDPMMDAAQKIAPFLVPIKNMGILARVYSNFVHTVTVYVGTGHGHSRFFMIDKYDGSEYLPNYGTSCSEKLTNSTEGVTYQQFITRNSTLKYWRKTLCKNAVLKYDHDVTKYGVTAYRFNVPPSWNNRTEPIESDCFKGQPPMPDGLSDLSKCYWNFPVAVSFPHFLYGDDILKNQVTGMKPNKTKHESYTVLEPITGVPLETYSRTQVNLIMRDMSGFNELMTPFNNTVIPSMWLEYNFLNDVTSNAEILDDISKYGLSAFVFSLPTSTFNRTEPATLDCFQGQPPLPDGLSDVSKCHWGFPIASSFPHYLYGDDVLNSYVTGLVPNKTKHASYVIVEPMTGVPLESKARSQSNLIVKKLTGFNELLTPFSELSIPMFWLEYTQVGLPWYIISLVYFQVNVLPILQRFITAFLLAGAVVLVCFYIKQKKRQRLLDNKVLVFEKEIFVAKP